MRLFGKLGIWFVGMAIVWSLLLAFMLNSNLQEHQKSVTSFALSEAEVLIQHMKTARSWNAQHGGIYVEVNEQTRSNPYLKGLVKEQDIVTPGGKQLTLVNPSYMTRLINENFNASDKRIAHITSLKPIRPANGPDAWERKALESFEQGKSEMYEITEIEGKPYMRLMRPLVVERECLKCHEAQGYKLGDIRGGITASVPYDKHATYLQQLNVDDSIAYGATWLLGLIGLGFGYRRLSSREEKLEQAQQDIHILSASVEQANEAVVITDSQGMIQYANPSFTRLTGYSFEEVVGKRPSMLKSGAHDDAFFQAIWKEIAAGRPWQGRVVNKRRDGVCYPAMLTISPIKNEMGEITHFVGSQQDLREYEHLEEQFHQAQKMEALGTLVGGIAHDFNNSLAGITGHAFLAKELVHDARAAERLESIEALAYRAAGMIQQLLAFSRRDVKSMNPMVISSFLKEAIKMHEVSIPENIRLINNVANSQMQVRGDINQLQQVVMNLLNNARDAVGDVHDPEIAIGLEEVGVDEAFAREHPDIRAERFARISISDNGTGIREEEIGHIFDPFFSTKEVGKGTGLGLSMAYGAIQSHGGVLTVESQVGKGTTFYIWLPLLPPDQMHMDSANEDAVQAGHGETILLVDDDVNVVDTSRDVLESFGYRVLMATDGEAAVDLYRQHKDEVDLVIMDIVMPKLGGVEAAAEIRRINPQVKVIFATGYDRSGSLQNKQLQQSDTVLSKPFSAARVSRVIRETLGR